MAEQSRVLLVEDERNLGLTLLERLKKEGFDSVLAGSVAEARRAVEARPFDLALLDVGLPDGSGFDIAELLKSEHPGTAIIFLTARGNPEDRIHGLELGAEDYVVKPFHLKELLLRVQNGLRRARFITDQRTANGETRQDEVTVGNATIRFSKFEAETGGAKHALTHKECALLRLLVERRGEVVSRDEILDRVWSKDEFPSPRTVDNFIMRLRRLVEFDVENPQVIRSVRGVGYQLM
ncbi:MAG: hypothetical protein A2X94_14210 [Bdellovibrionales bacterium GWB1_55_8]|nr:MAG: hypothetical protein A2X94_14210 [Bdellovibrionales bacterium GWB1_55_8]